VDLDGFESFALFLVIPLALKSILTAEQVAAGPDLGWHRHRHHAARLAWGLIGGVSPTTSGASA
jgi:hypothetical protein